MLELALHLFRACVLTSCFVAASGCIQRLHRQTVAPEAVATVDRKAPYLKVHMRDGSLFLLKPWQVNEATHQVSGSGTRYAPDRSVLGAGAFTIDIDSVALFETNVVRPSPSVAVLGVISGITAGVAVFCATNPKACFGSCPTFYVTDGTADVLQAEGFSASIAPSLEARDVDALFRARPRGREVRIRMANEAYETHIVRYANLLAVRRAPGRRAFADLAGEFWSTTAPISPTRCLAAEGSCADALSAFDGHERWSEADSTDLAARETIDLVFPPVAGGRPALAVASRQSLLPTYLLYQAFAYMGTAVGDWMAALERMDSSTRTVTNRVAATLGGIDVLVPGAANGWDSVATITETGPLAADVRLVPLPMTTDSVRVRLRMAKGAWRLDFAGAVAVEQRVEPRRVFPGEVIGDHGPDRDARARLLAKDDVLVTYPGDSYTLVYRLPDDAEHFELFLETRGYYLEWMRDEWIAEENRAQAAALFLDPAGSLRRLAPAFKRVEPSLEATFWRSKYVRPGR